MGFLLRVIVFLIVLGAIAWGGLSFYYGSPDPCRMLATERADDASEQLGLEENETVESVIRLGTSQMTTQECAQELFEIWTGGKEG